MVVKGLTLCEQNERSIYLQEGLRSFKKYIDTIGEYTMAHCNHIKKSRCFEDECQ